MKLSKGEIRRYVKEGGVYCPYCESDDLRGGDRDMNDGTMSQDITCQKCGQSWADLYKLYDVYEYDDGEEEGNG